MTVDRRTRFPIRRPTWFVLLTVGGFVVGFLPRVYQVLLDLRVVEGGPVLGDFVYPDDNTQVIGALCLAVVAGAACSVVNRSTKPGSTWWLTVLSVAYILAAAMAATLTTRLLHFKAPSANTAARLWFGVLAGSVLVAAVATGLRARRTRGA